MARDSSVAHDVAHDVVVIGAGPAGSSAALAAARLGADTLILDRSRFPRYKTCGGGLIGQTLGSLPGDLDVPVRQEIFATTFSRDGKSVLRRESRKRILSLVDRAEFDDALLARAVREGAVARLETTVTSIAEEGDTVVLGTNRGPVRARHVVGADGSASRTGRFVGVELSQVDLGLEVELEAGDHADAWRNRIHLDWGPIPGSYAWVFPKGERLTVGVIARKGAPGETRDYLAAFLRQQGLQDAKVVQDSGHLTRCRTPRSPLGKGRVVLCGDAAGLLEPWTREGISFAVRSGSMAGRLAAEAVQKDPEWLQAEYAERIASTLAQEMSAGATFLAAFERHPRIMHALLARTPVGWREFRRIALGETTFARATRHSPVRLALRLLTGPRTAGDPRD
ncbi:hyaluronate lyase [Acrocarpospora phusangensis]|uniref:Hyaluronate lyase n=1 Tax=Acrocarpospora phusangensis TaxID=1070424 RepID=A0A919Q9J9_9ACTN|nr:geranylgeranyl reductase family protein [Acrocarpospora phusangensis]GIH25034.1 hyaluronate lyase [Acrocarpospora phusangensis]